MPTFLHGRPLNVQNGQAKEEGYFCRSKQVAEKNGGENDLKGKMVMVLATKECMRTAKGRGAI